MRRGEVRRGEVRRGAVIRRRSGVVTSCHFTTAGWVRSSRSSPTTEVSVPSSASRADRHSSYAPSASPSVLSSSPRWWRASPPVYRSARLSARRSSRSHSRAALVRSPTPRRARTSPSRGLGLAVPVAVAAENAQALLEVRQGGDRFTEGQMGVADVAVRGVPDDHVVHRVADREAPLVMVDGGPGVGVLVQVAEVAVGDGLGVQVPQLPGEFEALQQRFAGLVVTAEPFEEHAAVVQAAPHPRQHPEPPPDRQRLVVQRERLARTPRHVVQAR